MSLPRYEEYKDSGVDWIGSVPAHWDIVALKHLLDIQNGADHKNVEQAEGFPVIGSGGQFAYASTYLYDGESVLLGRKGTIDKPLYFNGPFWTVDTMYWSKVRPGTNGRYAYYATLTIPFDYYSTNTALPSMTKGALSTHLIARPTLDEQSSIAAFLDRETAKIDVLIAEQEKLIVLLAEKRQATISQGVTKGINPNAPMKDSGVAWLGEVPVHWDVVTFQRCVYVQEGQVNPEEEPYRSMLLIAPNHIESGTGRLLYTETAHEQSAESGKYLCNAGDVIYSKIRPALRKVCIAPENCLCSADMYPLRGTSKLLNVFLKWFILSEPFSALAELESQRVAMPKINRESLKVVWLAVPSLQEQEAIDAFLNEETAKLDLLADAASTAIKLLTERRSALIAAAVTGQIDVRSMISQVAAERPEAIAA
ncbi:restriction endonuclease subunit S [Massilia sp.]|uniref:restriction endonuclease subunit S n=1 Tax=Massilia sp. TaxID=1882437 RepID=UPI0028A6E8E7|nr:restriction endonuclease subunit S [Massilia sp.]